MQVNKGDTSQLSCVGVSPVKHLTSVMPKEQSSVAGNGDEGSQDRTGQDKTPHPQKRCLIVKLSKEKRKDDTTYVATSTNDSSNGTGD
jgi:hypothetical protein